MVSSSYSIQELLNNHQTPLGKLVARAKSFLQRNETVQQILDPSLAPHCQVASYEQGKLLLLADSAAWATLLRYQIPTLLQSLRAHASWGELRTIQVKVGKAMPPAAL